MLKKIAIFSGIFLQAGLALAARQSKQFVISGTTLAPAASSITGFGNSSLGYIGDGSRLTNLPSSGSTDPTLVSTFTFSIGPFPGNAVVSTQAYDSLSGMQWFVHRDTIVLVDIEAFCGGTSSSALVATLLRSTGTFGVGDSHYGNYKPVHTSSLTIVSGQMYSGTVVPNSITTVNGGESLSVQFTVVATTLSIVNQNCGIAGRYYIVKQ